MKTDDSTDLTQREFEPPPTTTTTDPRRRGDPCEFHKKKKSECIIFRTKKKDLWQLFTCRIVTKSGTAK